jgi:hypothetical protein
MTDQLYQCLIIFDDGSADPLENTANRTKISIFATSPNEAESVAYKIYGNRKSIFTVAVFDRFGDKIPETEWLPDVPYQCASS